MGSRKPSKTGTQVLRTIWAERLRQRGFINPTRVHALSQLTPRGRSNDVVPGETFADDMSAQVFDEVWISGSWGGGLC